MVQSKVKYVLAAEGIEKRYPGVLALDKIDFEILPGEVHGLIGGNGAGKSTLMKILAGVIQPNQGSIRLDGLPVRFSSPREANDLGITLVHQEINLVPHLTVAENIFLGRELLSKFGMVQSKKQNDRCRELLTRLDNSIDPRTEVCNLRVGQQQIVEIAKAINCKARVIFMDEPSSAISNTEVEALFRLIRSLRDEGVSIVYVSHKLEELLAVSDRITVLRDGKKVETVQTCQTDRSTIIRMMAGRELTELYVHSEPQQKKSESLRVESLSLTKSSSTRPAVDNVSLTAYRGQVLGVFGLMGAGRTELLESIFGLHHAGVSGRILIDGVPTRIQSPKQAILQGIGLVPEDRKLQGLIMTMSLAENISLSTLQDIEVAGLLVPKLERQRAWQFVQQFSIKSPSISQQVRTLSGGNQQKVVLSKVLCCNPKILLLDEPTRGIDVGSKHEIYALIDQLKSKGLAIIVVSSELSELLGIADRIMVMCEGKKTAEFDRKDANEELLMVAAVPTAMA